MVTDMKLDVRGEFAEALAKVDPEVVKFLAGRPHIATEVLNQVANKCAERDAMRRERDLAVIEVASLREQLRGTEDAIKAKREYATPLAQLQSEDRLLRQRDDLVGKIASYEANVRYLEAQLAG